MRFNATRVLQTMLSILVFSGVLLMVNAPVRAQEATEFFIGCFPGSITITDNSPAGVAANCTNGGTVYNSPPGGQAQLTDTRHVRVSCDGGSTPTSGPFEGAIFILCPSGEGTSLGGASNPSLEVPMCFARGSSVSCPSDDPSFVNGNCYAAGELGGWNEVSCDSGDAGVDNGITTDDCDAEDNTLTSDNCGIIRLLVNGINFLSALAGMAIVASIMVAGFQYMTAQDNSGQIQAARTRIIWAIVALLIMIFMYAFLNWVVPGGVL